MKKLSIYRDQNPISSKLNYQRCGNLTLENLLEVIEHGGGVHHVPDFKSLIAQVRDGGKNAKRLKQHLHGVTLAAEFTSGERTKSAPSVLSGFMVLDWDNNDPAVDVTKIKDKVIAWDNAHAVFVSPSGTGLKVILQINGLTPGNYEWVFMCMCWHFEDKLNLTLDGSGSDISRLCYLSYDPSVYITSYPGGALQAPEILERYADKLPATKQGVGLNIEASSLDQGTLAAIFTSYVEQVKENGLEWKSGQRNAWLLALTGLKRYGMNAADVVPCAIAHINGRWTNERTEEATVEAIEYNFNRYYTNYNAVSLPDVTMPLRVDNYLTEELEAVVARLKSCKMLYLEAPTGAGKTTLVCHLARHLGIKIDLATPTRVLAEQAKDDSGSGATVAYIIGDTKLTQPHIDADVLAATYQKIKVLRPRGATVLVVDEAHSLVSDYNWKMEAVHDLLDAAKRYEYVIFLSGSMYPLSGFLTKENYLKVEKVNRFNYDYSLVKLDQPNQVKEYFTASVREGCLNVLYWNDKRQLERVKRHFAQTDKKVLVLSRDERDKNEPAFAAAYSKLIDAGVLNGVDVLLTTCFVQAGVNIHDRDRPVHITFAGMASPVDIIQFTARFRKMKPSVTILHQCQTEPLRFYDEKRARQGLKWKIKAYEGATAAQIGFSHDEAAASMKRINAKLEGVRCVHNKYILDPYFIAYQHFDCSQSNARSNKLTLHQVLSRHNFTLAGESVHACNGAENAADYGTIGRLLLNEKAAATEQIVNEMLGKGYVYRLDPSNPLRYRLERRHQFISRYVSNEQIAAEKLLTDANFKVFSRRVQFLLAEGYHRSSTHLAAPVFIEFEAFQKLRCSVTEGDQYSKRN